jgi:hypothetical protein
VRASIGAVARNEDRRIYAVSKYLWPDPVDWSTRNESGGWGRQDLVLVPGVCRCGVYPVEGVSAGAGR